MKALIASVAVLALAITTWAEEAKTDSGKGPQTAVLRRLPPLDAGKLEPTYRGDWQSNVGDFSDDKNGVFIRVVERKQEEPRCVAGSRWEVVAESGATWVRVESTSLSRITTVRLRLAADNIRYLVRASESPLLARYVALRCVFDVEGLDRRERIELIESASGDASAAMRRMATQMAGTYASSEDAVPILCRALCDPCIEVADCACVHLRRLLFPADYKETGGYSRMGSRDAIDRAVRRSVLVFARRVHGVRPDLVTEADLATINAMCLPSVGQTERDLELPTAAEPAEKPNPKKNNQPAPK